nr:hypothetical protein [Tanacetum cinerariifolium]
MSSLKVLPKEEEMLRLQALGTMTEREILAQVLRKKQRGHLLCIGRKRVVVMDGLARKDMVGGRLCGGCVVVVTRRRSIKDDEDEEIHDVDQDSRANLVQAGEYGVRIY